MQDERARAYLSAWSSSLCVSLLHDMQDERARVYLFALSSSVCVSLLQKWPPNRVYIRNHLLSLALLAYHDCYLSAVIIAASLRLRQEPPAVDRSQFMAARRPGQDREGRARRAWVRRDGKLSYSVSLYRYLPFLLPVPVSVSVSVSLCLYLCLSQCLSLCLSLSLSFSFSVSVSVLSLSRSLSLPLCAP